LAINTAGTFLAVSGTDGGFDPFYIDTFHLANPLGFSGSAFAIKFDQSGKVVGSNIIGANSATSGLTININSLDQVSIGGEGGGFLTFDGDTVGETIGNDAFFATMRSSDMHFIHSEILYGTGFTDGINVLASDARNNLYVGGYIQGNLYEGSDTFVRGLIGGLTDIFVGKYGVVSCICNNASASFSETHTGHSFTYTSTSTNADSLFWIFGDGATQAGGTTASHSYTTGTPHSVCLWAYNDCSRDSSCLVTTGIEGVANVQIEVYPNPATDILKINNQSPESCTLQITDINGRSISNTSIAPGLHSMDVSSFASGIYFVRLSQSLAVRYVKLVVGR
jgi:Secretion system C-terminal sorting domain